MAFIHKLALVLVTLAVTFYGILWSIPSEQAFEMIFGRKMDDNHLRFAFNLIGAYMLSLSFMGFWALFSKSLLEKKFALRVFAVLVALVIGVGLTHKSLFVEFEWYLNMVFNTLVFLLCFLGGFVIDLEKEGATSRAKHE